MLSLGGILGLKLLDLLKYQMYLLTEGVLLNGGLLDKFSQNGVGLHQPAHLQLEVGVRIHTREFQLWKFHLEAARPALPFLLVYLCTPYHCSTTTPRLAAALTYHDQIYNNIRFGSQIPLFEIFLYNALSRHHHPRQLRLLHQRRLRTHSLAEPNRRRQSAHTDQVVTAS